MKAIMISIKPKHLFNILIGKKKIEARKNKALANATKKMIAEQGYALFLAYCSKNEYLYRTNKGYLASNKPLKVGKGTDYTFAYSDEGKVICSFKCYKVEEHRPFFHWCEELQKQTCLTRDDVLDYLDSKDKSVGNPKRQGKVYAINITKLEIFDKPKELSEFKYERKFKNTPVIEIAHLTKSPQNFAYVEIEE